MDLDQLDEYIERELPSWRRAVREAKKEDADVIFNTGAFGTYPDELMRIGAAIKYAHLFDVSVQVLK